MSFERWCATCTHWAATPGPALPAPACCAHTHLQRVWVGCLEAVLEPGSEHIEGKHAARRPTCATQHKVQCGAHSAFIQPCCTSKLGSRRGARKRGSSCSRSTGTDDKPLLKPSEKPSEARAAAHLHSEARVDVLKGAGGGDPGAVKLHTQPASARRRSRQAGKQAAWANTWSRMQQPPLTNSGYYRRPNKQRGAHLWPLLSMSSWAQAL